MPRVAGLSCRDVERAHGDSGCKCVHYRELFPEGDCERCSVSDHSPGLVDDPEILCRLILPSHLLKDSLAIDPAVLRAVEALGLSMIRARHVSLDDLGKRALAYAKRKNVPLSDVSLAAARCGDARAIASSGARGYRVYDTATEHDPAHTDICRALAFPPGAPDQRSRFRGLIQDFSEVFSVDRGVFG